MAAQKTAFEFLPQEDWEKGTAGELLKWALTVGRHIVIFTELLVILAFLSRFKLDRDLTDLSEKIKQKQAIVTASSQFEKEFRLLDKRLNSIESLRTDQLDASEILSNLAGCLPVDVYLSEFNITGGQVSLAATSLSEVSLGRFLKNLKDSQKFEKIKLSQVSSGVGTEIGIKFQLKAQLIR